MLRPAAGAVVAYTLYHTGLRAADMPDGCRNRQGIEPVMLNDQISQPHPVAILSAQHLLLEHGRELIRLQLSLDQQLFAQKACRMIRLERQAIEELLEQDGNQD